MGDYHDGANAVTPGGTPPIPSHVSFDVRWQGDGDRQKIRDETFGFTGQYVAGPTTISFTAWNDDSDVVYSSIPDGQYNIPGPPANPGGTGLPAVGHERNGKFFS